MKKSGLRVKLDLVREQQALIDKWLRCFTCEEPLRWQEALILYELTARGLTARDCGLPQLLFCHQGACDRYAGMYKYSTGVAYKDWVQRPTFYLHELAERLEDSGLSDAMRLVAAIPKDRM